VNVDEPFDGGLQGRVRDLKYLWGYHWGSFVFLFDRRGVGEQKLKLVFAAKPMLNELLNDIDE
jgi:hypothetical protein